MFITDTGLDYIITGCPKSGTKYMAELLTVGGIPCSHEYKYRLVGVPTPRKGKAESSWVAAPYVADTKAKVIHIVRNPLEVISTLRKVKFFERESHAHTSFVLNELPQLRKLKPIDRYERFWIDWNALIKPHADFTVRVEEGEKIFEKLKIKPQKIYQNKKCNTNGIRQIWDRKLSTEFIRTANYYGYTI